MPSTISFLPVPATAPASASAPATPASDQPSGEAETSFDSVLSQAGPAPCAKPGPRTAVTGSARASHEEGRSTKTGKADKAAEEPVPETQALHTERPLLNPEELAALLALMGAPAPQPQPQPLPPVVPVDLTLSASTRAPGSDEVPVECAAEFSAPQATAGNDRPSAVPPAVPGTVRAQETDTHTVFALDVAATSALAPAEAAVTTRDLLKQGAEVIDYQLGPFPAARPGAAPVSTETMVPPLPTAASDDAEKPATAVTPAPAAVIDSTEESATFARQSSAPAGQPLDAAALRRFATQKTAARTTSEKIAATLDSRVPPVASGVNPSIEANKNNFLNVGVKDLTKDTLPVGTSAANWGDSMNQDARSTPFVARLIDGALSLLGTSPAGAAAMARPFETAATPPVSSAQAAQIVSEIRDIADGLWAVGRNSVEVRFNFSETERLSVKVEYRDGVVRTTFRTDSPELRDTIAREWQSQVATSSDSRPYRVADPVFNTPPADARGFSSGGDSSRQQRQAEQSGNAPHTFATASGRGQSSSSVAAAPAASFTRPDTAVHLHAFA